MNTINKRIASAFLVFIMIFQTYTACSAAEEESTFSVLPVKLGIIEESLDMEETVTRGEMASAAAKILGIYDMLSDGLSVFSDISAESKASGYMNALYALGYISGYDNCFNPEGNATVYEMVKLMASVSGYKAIAEFSGGFPMGYVAQAKKAGILDGVYGNGSEELTYKVFTRLLYNTLNAEFLKPLSFGESIEYGTSDNYTVMKEFFDIDKISGIMSGNPYTMLYTDEQETKEGSVEIEGEIIFTDDKALYEYLGYRVDCYFKADEKDDVKTAIYVEPLNDKNKVLKVFSDDAEVFEAGGRLLYFGKNGKKNDAVVRLAANVIYNGRFMEKYANADKNIMIPQYGDITLVDNDRDGSYDVVKIAAYKVMLVENVGKSNETITGKDGESIYFGEEDEENKKIITAKKNGKNVLPRQLAEGDFLEVKESLDRELIDITVLDTGAEGTIKGFGKDTVSIDDAAYEIMNKLDISKINVGDTVTYYLNSHSQLAYIDYSKITRDGMKYGVLIDYGIESKGVRKSFVVKIFTEDGDIKIYKADDKCIVDGAVLEDASKISNVISDGEQEVKRQLIKYKLTEEEKIKSIDTEKEEAREGESSLQKGPAGNKMRYKLSTRTFGLADFIIDSYTTVFCIPENQSYDTEYYRIAKSGELVNDTYYNVKAYDLDAYLTARAVVLTMPEDEYKLAGDNGMFVVADIENVMNSDGEIVIQLTGGYGTNPDSKYWYRLDAVDMPDFEKGGVYQIKAFGNGMLIAARTLVESNTDFGYGASEYSTVLYNSYGTVVRKHAEKNYVVVNVSKTDGEELKVENIGTRLGFKYNRATEKLEKAAVSDIEPGQEIYIRERHQEPYEFVIFE